MYARLKVTRLNDKGWAIEPGHAASSVEIRRDGVIVVQLEDEHAEGPAPTKTKLLDIGTRLRIEADW